MAPEITRLPALPDWLDRPDMQHLFKVLKETGIEGRFVGGCVRDFLVGAMVDDFDIAVDCKPDHVMEALKASGIKVIPTGIAHGTVTAVLNQRPCELTSLRKDVETDGRHAKVEFTADWRQDAARRDFTMNALYLDQQGNLHDYFGGWNDLKNGQVRFVGNPHQRMTEDALRLLRFFRFSASYGRGRFDQDVLSICRQCVDHLPRLASERIWQEWEKLLRLRKIASTVSAMQEIGMFQTIYRRMPVQPTAQDIACLDLLDGQDPLLRLAALHIHLDRKQAAQLANGLRFSNPEKDYFIGLYTPLELFEDLTAKVFYATYKKLGPELAKAIAQLGKICNREGDWDGLHIFAEKTGQPEFPLSGRHLLQMGVEAGPKVGQILQQVEDQWIASGFQLDHAACLARLKQIAK